MKQLVAFVVVLLVGVASGRSRFLVFGGNSPSNPRSVDPCAVDNLYISAYGPGLSPATPEAAAALAECQNGLTTTANSITLLGPSPNSEPNSYSPTNPYTITITGNDLDATLFGAPLLIGDVVGFVYLAAEGADCSTPETADPVLAVPHPVAYLSDTQLTFDLQLQPPTIPPTRTWLTTGLELESAPRLICFQPIERPLGAWAVTTPPRDEQAFFTGIAFGVVYACQNDLDCSPASNPYDTTPYDPLEPFQRSQLKARKTCCAGTCINNLLTGCCGTAGTPFELANEKCCNVNTGTVQFIESACPCRTVVAAPSTPVCPDTEPECCLPTKYTELAPIDCSDILNLHPLCNEVWGQCFNPATHRCCDTGSRYDPGAQQCCSINGLQQLTDPCPCDTDVDCIGGDVADWQGNRLDTTGHTCCKQTAPPLPLVDGSICTRFMNFPAGSSPANQNRCQGVCIDPRYQICCNGATCIKDFERCCNNTCCNIFTGTCTDRSPRERSPFQANNWVNYKLTFEQCTTIEKLDEIRSFWIFVLPTMLLLATLGGVALVLVFANKASARVFSFIEKAMIALSLFIILLIVQLYFSPAYKYGAFIVLGMLLTIVCASARIRWLNIAVLVFQLVLLWYIFDPFPGNDYLNLTYLRFSNQPEEPRNGARAIPVQENRPFAYANGLFHSIDLFWRFQDIDRTGWFGGYCAAWYNGYFAVDLSLRDIRQDNPDVLTFGYCTRGWITALMYLSCIAAFLLVLLFLLTALALILRFRKNRMEPIELEIRPEPVPVIPVPVPVPAPVFAEPMPAYVVDQPLVAPFGAAPFGAAPFVGAAPW